MKFMIFLSFFYLASVAQAAEITVLESKLTNTQSYYQSVDTRFQINQTTGQGYAEVTVFEDRYPLGSQYPGSHYPGPGWNGRHGMPQPIPTVIYQNKIAIEGLILVGDKLIYQDVSGDVDCGTLGVSRIFKRPTIFLTGLCKLSGKVDRKRHLSVTLITK